MEENKVQQLGEKFGIDQQSIDEVKKEYADPGRFTSFIDRIERLEEQKAEFAADIRKVYSEAKGEGFDVKVMRQIIKLRKLDPADRAESEFLRDEYKKLVGISE